MWIFLIAVFLKGPVWLRVIAWSFVGVIVLFTCLLAFTRPGSPNERPGTDHVYSNRPHQTEPVRH